VPFATNFRELAPSVGNGMRRCRGMGSGFARRNSGGRFNPHPRPLSQSFGRLRTSRGRGESESSNIFGGEALSKVAAPREARGSSRLNINRWKVED
jgi:hypothetical protein